MPTKKAPAKKVVKKSAEKKVFTKKYEPNKTPPLITAPQYILIQLTPTDSKKGDKLEVIVRGMHPMKAIAVMEDVKDDVMEAMAKNLVDDLMSTKGKKK